VDIYEKKERENIRKERKDDSNDEVVTALIQ
jgi:hypothetical protein